MIGLWSGIGEGLLILLAKSSVVFALALGSTRLSRRAPAIRHIVWMTAIVGMACIPVFDRFAALPLRVLPAVPSVVLQPTARVTMHPGPGDVRSVGIQVSGKAFHPPVLGGLSATQIALAVWASVAMLLLVRVGVGIIAVRRLIRRSRGVSSLVWTEALALAVRHVPTAVVPRLLMSDDAEMAFVSQVSSPAIVLPASADDWPVDRRHSVLLHELAHIQRHDLATLAVARVACAVQWFNPFMWLAAERLNAESERASDEIVLVAGVAPSAYAQHLLDLVTTLSHRVPALTMAVAAPREFEGRVVAILDRSSRRSVSRRQKAIFAGSLSLAVVCVGAAAPLPRRSFTATNTAHLPAPLVERPSQRAVARGGTALPVKHGRGGRVVATMPLQKGEAPSTLNARRADSIGIRLNADEHSRAALDTFMRGQGFQTWTYANAEPGSPAPRFPDALRQARTPGVVLAQFVVAPAGRVDNDKTIAILASTNELFSTSVRQALASMRFTPAEVDGRRVKQVTQMLFSFVIDGENRTSMDSTYRTMQCGQGQCPVLRLAGLMVTAVR